jgi:hypothetical protein
MPEIRPLFQRVVEPTSLCGRAQARRWRDFAGRPEQTFRDGLSPPVPNSPRRSNFFVASALQIPVPPADPPDYRGIQMNTKIKVKAAALPSGLPLRFYLAVAAIALALLAIPQFGHAQGIVRGAQEGTYEGSRVAGPVGGVVGGAVGAGVGGAMGAVNGVLGLPNHGYYRHHCHGYYNRYGHFRCYR